MKRYFLRLVYAYLVGAVIGIVTGLVLCSKAEAGEYLFKYGVGILLKDQNSLAEVKHFSAGYRWQLADTVFDQKVEAGLWADQRSSRKSSGYGSYSLGVRVEPEVLYLESFWGIGGITHTDSNLSTNFQFVQDFGIGVHDKKGRSIGLSYKHLSNAGIKTPNKGRDFILFQVGVNFD